jgi:hypothetical protein
VSLLRDGRFDVPGWTPHEPARSERGVAVVE